MSDEAKPERKVIDATVGAQAGPAEIGVNQEPKLSPPFYVREVPHHRIECDERGEQAVRRTIVEYEVLRGEVPKGFWRFQGVGLLLATVQAPSGQPQQIRRDYHFLVVGNTIDEAWENFDACLERGAAEAKANFEAEYRDAMSQAQQRLVVPPAGAAKQILGASGQPLRRG